MLLHVSDSATQQHRRLCSNILVADYHLTALRLDEPVEAAKERGLSGAAFADERGCAPRGNVDAYIVEGNDVAETMRDVACGERNRHGLKSDGN